MSILNPLFSYRKYLIAGRLLKECTNSHGIIAEIKYDDGQVQPVHQKGYLLNFAKYFLKANPKISPDRLLEILELLSNNGHIELNMNNDVYMITYRANRNGEYAVNDGFYTMLAYKKIAGIIAAAAGVLATIIPALIWLIKQLRPQ